VSDKAPDSRDSVNTVTEWATRKSVVGRNIQNSSKSANENANKSANKSANQNGARTTTTLKTSVIHALNIEIAPEYENHVTIGQKARKDWKT
jgi:hypothetical protein